MFITTTLLALFFALASSIKLIGWQKLVFETQLSFFKKYGLNRQIMFLVGVVEAISVLFLVASLLLELPLSNILGAAGIALTSLGAMFFHFRFDTFKDAVPSIVTLTLSATLLYMNSAVITTWF